MKLDELFPWLNKDDGKIDNENGLGSTFEQVVEERLSRRSLLKSSAVGLPMMVLGAEALQSTAEAQTPSTLTFTPVQLIREDIINVPQNHAVGLVIGWGSPMTANAPEFNLNGQTAEAQAGQFGYNCDFVGYYPLPGPESTNSTVGLLAVNFEYTNPELMFPGYDAANPTKEQVDIDIAAHGIGVVEIQRTSRSWEYTRFSRYNRRITGETEMEITGPAAGADLMKTSADPTGTKARGTLNNCAGGRTPWGTVLSAEENFHQYFAHLNGLADGPVKTAHRRYGVPTGASERKWERFYDRFDVSKEPNEPFRFGWIVEFDPYDPTFVPKKRTGLGRTRHEAATVMVNADNRVAFYSGDDQVFEYVYKFVSAGKYEPNNRDGNLKLMDEGVLYVAKYNADGTGEWIPMVFGEGALTAANGFSSQADVLIRTRDAADRLGATKMDRPEDMEGTPVTGKLYLALTNNGSRTEAQIDVPNPRAINRHGHIIEMTETNNNYAGTTFKWEIFMLCGDPKAANAPKTYFAGFDPSKVSPISCPDNLAFDKEGNLWIATDGQPGTLQRNDGVYVVPTQGPDRGNVRHFMSTPLGAEACGPEFTPDYGTLFVAVQHPGEGGVLGKSVVSNWPDSAQPPRPSVISIVKAPGSASNVIGTR